MKTTSTIIGLLLLTLLPLPCMLADEMRMKSEPAKGSKSSQDSAERRKKAEPKKERTRAQEAVTQLTEVQRSKLLALLNGGTQEEIAEIKGIAKTKSQSIIEARPYKTVEEVVTVKGIGVATFSNLVSHGKTMVGG